MDIAAAKTVEVFRDPRAAGLEEDDFEQTFAEQMFVTEDSAQQSRPVEAGGESKHVSFGAAVRFAELALELRLNEAADQLACVREGLAEIVAQEGWCLWSWRVLEEKVVGILEVDVKLLKSKTRYDGYSEGDDAIKFFWEALEGFSQEDLRSFLHFVWGRSRLPPSESSLWGNGLKVKRTGLSVNALPNAHTCFFQIDLPAYDSVERASNRILFAVKNCISMNIA